MNLFEDDARESAARIVHQLAGANGTGHKNSVRGQRFFALRRGHQAAQQSLGKIVHVVETFAQVRVARAINFCASISARGVNSRLGFETRCDVGF